MNKDSFKLISEYSPKGDQPAAIAALNTGITQNKKHQILLGVTGSGKTFTIANVIANVNKPALVIAHNKTLAAQLCSEFRELFPDNAVEYFVSYYDYYQPEAYIPSRDVYIEKEADINDEIERLRHSATRSLLTRRDVIIVASVSCIYGLGTPEDYAKGILKLNTGSIINRHKLLMEFERIRYERNDFELLRNRYRIKGDTIDIFPSWEENIVRLEFFGDELEQIKFIHPVTNTTLEEIDRIFIFPATHYLINENNDRAIKEIQEELNEHLKTLNRNGKIVEAKRIEQRTGYDMEMIREIGYCKGIENYSRVLSNRLPGEAPGVLLDFFPDDYLTIIDESHATIPQIRGMHAGDYSRKKMLIEHGFRLPSAIDNRPLKFDEFESSCKQIIYVSATPGPYEVEKSKIDDKNYNIVEQLIRPTGLIDPEVVIKSTKNQIDDLLSEVSKRVDLKERTLITTITKKLAEELCNYLDEKDIKATYLHSEIRALDRIDILHHLRTGKFDVLVGVNLLREGLDLPEVSLVAIMDADKEGFLRNERSLIQTIGRAARNINGKVILYADSVTKSIERAVTETNRRRKIQIAYNKKHNITPRTITKKIVDIRQEDREKVLRIEKEKNRVSPDKLPSFIAKLTKDMNTASKNLEFELAAVIRDQIKEIQNLEKS
ncbi:MAG: excinuclease ABC subunit UvrB [bacterium]|nr:excinuclease ABC subunit UvrB [bacterium]